MPGPVTAPVTHNTEVSVIRGILAFIVVFLLATFPATWLLMLFFGNLGLELSYWGTFPLGILVSVLLGGVTAPKYATY
jgi:Na+-translocating ferredoxin:NAD+ oxidoreductase RnfD subunit